MRIGTGPKYRGFLVLKTRCICHYLSRFEATPTGTSTMDSVVTPAGEELEEEVVIHFKGLYIDIFRRDEEDNLVSSKEILTVGMECPPEII